MMKIPSVIVDPSGRVPEKASRWNHGRKETCDGGKSISGGSPMYWEYLGIYRGGMRLNRVAWESRTQGARPVSSWLSLTSSGLLPNLLGSFWSRKNHRKVSSCLEFVWY